MRGGLALVNRGPVLGGDLAGPVALEKVARDEADYRGSSDDRPYPCHDRSIVSVVDGTGRLGVSLSGGRSCPDPRMIVAETTAG
ncbi:hypothetical protein GCM10027280_17840 [Micromonospora polyrhachis]